MALQPTVVSTKFVSTAQDSIQGVDVYTTNRNTPINNLIDALSSDATSLLKSLSGMLPIQGLLDVVSTGIDYAATVASDVQDAKAFAKRLDDLTKTNWTNVAKTVGSGMLSQMLAGVGVDSVSPELLAGIMGVPGSPPLSELLADNIPAVRIVMNDTVQSIVNGDYAGAQGLAAMLNAVAGDKSLSQIFDANAQAALYGTLVTTARGLGLGAAIYGTVIGQIQDYNDQISFILAQLPDAADACDLDFINQALSNCGAGRIIQNVPDIVQRMLKGYHRDPNLSPHDAFLATLSCIMQINPTWDQSSRGSQPVSDLTPFSTASADAIAALEQYDVYRIPAAIAKLYPPGSLVRLGQAMWPVNTIQTVS